MLIDVHTHAWPKWTRASVRSCFKTTGADMMFLAAAADEYAAYWNSDTNEGCARMVKAFPDKVVGLVGIHPPNVEQSLKAIDRYHGKGFVGVKLMPTVGYYPDDEKHRRVFEEINARKLIVLSHCGWCAPTQPKDLPQCTLYSHPYRFEPLLRTFPDMDVIFAHGGGRTMFQAAFELVHYHRNAWVDTCPGNGTWVLHHAGDWLNFLDWDRLLFGTDTVVGNPASEEQFKRTEDYVRVTLRVTGFERRTDDVMGGNARRLLEKHGVRVR